MNKLVLSILLILTTVTLTSQQLSVYNLRLYRPSLDNPAGLFMNRSDLSLFLVHNKQWVGVEKAPISTNISIAKKFENNMAFGLVVNSDRAGMFKTNQLETNYAYQFRLNQKGYLGLGLGIGLTHHSFDFTSVDVIDSGDGVLDLSGEQRILMDGNAGLYYYQNNFHFGVSLPHILEKKANYTVLDNDFSYLFNRQLVANIGVKSDSLIPHVQLEPFAQFRMIPGVISQLDLGLNTKINEKCVLSLAYRTTNSLVFGVGFSLNEKMNLYYSADFGSNEIYSRSQGSHEVAMSFRFMDSEKPSEEMLEENLIASLELDSISEIVDSLDLKMQQICTCKDIEVYVKYLNDRIDSLGQANSGEYVQKLDQIKNGLVDGVFNADGERVPNNYDMNLNQLNVGHVFMVNDVQFKTGSFELSPASLDILDLFVDFLLQNPSVTIEIGGHTDERGTDLNNLVLSKNRARAVYMYFLVSGVKGNRMQYDGFGESRPVAPNTNEEGRARNRRTEIMITGK